jgi:hypothetical protein
VTHRGEESLAVISHLFTLIILSTIFLKKILFLGLGLGLNARACLASVRPLVQPPVLSSPKEHLMSNHLSIF